MNEFFNDLGATLAWLGTSFAMMVAGFGVVDLLTPGKLREQVSENLNAGLLVGGKLISVSVIVFSAVWTAADDLGEGLLDAVLYGALGLVISAVAYLLIDLALPVRLRHLVNESRFDPATCVAVGADLGAALVIAAAIS